MIPYVTVFVHGREKTDRDRTNRSILTQPIGISNDFCRQLSIGERKAVMKCILMRIYERSEIGDGISESLQIQLIYRFSCAEVDVHFVRFRFYDFRLSSPVVSPRMASRPTPANRITRLHGIFNCGHNFIWFFSVFASMQWDLNKKKTTSFDVHVAYVRLNATIQIADAMRTAFDLIISNSRICLAFSSIYFNSLFSLFRFVFGFLNSLGK